MALLMGGVPSSAVGARAAGGAASSCGGGWVWPLGRPQVAAAYDPPDKPWLAGHRGVDLKAAEGDVIRAPSDGVVRFSGSVGGKAVVSIDHGGLVSSFEPARTDLAVGEHVRRGESFARIEGTSDHCDGACLHWGVKRGGAATGADSPRASYLDPQSRIGGHRMGLKPVLE
ncbi:M23 family metallopeptidase [Bifidobacterium leontopitheci]